MTRLSISAAGVSACDLAARARGGEPSAMMSLALRCASEASGQPDWVQALDWAVQAAIHGLGEAEESLVVLCQQAELLEELVFLAQRGSAPDSRFWMRAGAGIDLDKLLTPQGTLVQVIDDPQAWILEGLADDRLCRWLMLRAHPHLQRATSLMAGSSTAIPDPRRTNTSAHFGDHNTGLPVMALRCRMAALLGTPLAHLEPTNVLRYCVGQTYRPHLDAWTGADAAVRGQRTHTLLLYLNEDYQGGETSFPAADFRFRGQPGQALLWKNLNPGGERNQRSVHTGLPPVAGEKWVLSQWVQDRPYRDPDTLDLSG